MSAQTAYLEQNADSISVLHKHGAENNINNSERFYFRSYVQHSNAVSALPLRKLFLEKRLSLATPYRAMQTHRLG